MAVRGPNPGTRHATAIRSVPVAVAVAYQTRLPRPQSEERNTVGHLCLVSVSSVSPSPPLHFPLHSPTRFASPHHASPRFAPHLYAADAPTMAPTARPPRRPATLTLLLPLLLLSSSYPSVSFADSPPPSSPAPRHAPPRQVASDDAPSPPRHPGHHQHTHRRRPPPPPPKRRLNFGERLGIAFAGVAVAMQVVLGAFLALRAWQLRRLDRAEVSSSTPLT